MGAVFSFAFLLLQQIAMIVPPVSQKLSQILAEGNCEIRWLNVPYLRVSGK